MRPGWPAAMGPSGPLDPCRDVAKLVPLAPRHSGTASASARAATDFASAETGATSAVSPSRSSGYARRSTIGISPLVMSKSTDRSMSLSGSSTPRATEPKTLTFEAPTALASWTIRWRCLRRLAAGLPVSAHSYRRQGEQLVLQHGATREVKTLNRSSRSLGLTHRVGESGTRPRISLLVRPFSLRPMDFTLPLVWRTRVPIVPNMSDHCGRQSLPILLEPPTTMDV